MAVDPEVNQHPSGRQRASAAVCALGVIYGVPLLWVIVTLLRGHRATGLERYYARSAPLFQGMVFLTGSLIAIVVVTLFGTDSAVPFVVLALLLLGPTLVTLLSVYRAARGTRMGYPCMGWSDRWVDR